MLDFICNFEIIMCEKIAYKLQSVRHLIQPREDFKQKWNVCTNFFVKNRMYFRDPIERQI